MFCKVLPCHARPCHPMPYRTMPIQYSTKLDNCGLYDMLVYSRGSFGEVRVRSWCAHLLNLYLNWCRPNMQRNRVSQTTLSSGELHLENIITEICKLIRKPYPKFRKCGTWPTKIYNMGEGVCMRFILRWGRTNIHIDTSFYATTSYVAVDDHINLLLCFLVHQVMSKSGN